MQFRRVARSYGTNIQWKWQKKSLFAMCFCYSSCVDYNYSYIYSTFTQMRARLTTLLLLWRRISFVGWIITREKTNKKYNALFSIRSTFVFGNGENEKNSYNFCYIYKCVFRVYICFELEPESESESKPEAQLQLDVYSFANVFLHIIRSRSLSNISTNDIFQPTIIQCEFSASNLSDAN